MRGARYYRLTRRACGRFTSACERWQVSRRIASPSLCRGLLYETEHCQGARFQLIGIAPRHWRHVPPTCGFLGVSDQLPLQLRSVRRENKRHGFMVGIQQDKEGIVHETVSAFVHLINGIAGQPKAEAACFGIGPILLGHFIAIRAEPGEILHLGAADLPALKEFATSEGRMLLE